MGWFFETITLQQLIAQRTQERNSTGPDGKVYKETCLAHAYVADTESFGILWCVCERRNSQSLENVERRIVCNLIESRNGMLGCKTLCETDYPSYSSVPLSFFSMVPIEVYGGDAEWREAVLHDQSCDEIQHRPGLVQLLDAVAKGDVEVLFCSDITRLTRSLPLEIIGALQKAEVQIVTADGIQIGFADLIANTLINQMPKTFVEAQSQRIKAGIRAARERRERKANGSSSE